jgi:hypothetical protein
MKKHIGGIQMDKLQKSLVETIHKGALDVSDLAEAWGLTENSIYKMGLEDSGLLIKFFADPSEECREKLMDALTDVTERSLAIKKRIANGNQLDIFTSEQ